MNRFVASLLVGFAVSLLAAPVQARPGQPPGLEIAAAQRPSITPGPAIPEPTGALLFAAGVFAAGAYTRRRRSA